MKDSLKGEIEKIVDDSIGNFDGKKLFPKRIAFIPNRIVLFSSRKLKIDVSTTIFNYLQNCFYNTQWHIDNPIPVEIISHCNAERDKQEGDYVVDVGSSLIRYLTDSNDFLKS